ncbi:hypothetical protein, partial [Gracilibacillus oryzae]|uniref:hypothetical protein n=1 Tax=Gracilibacillus oryzae TaxID=1672701 RepID=UPI001D18BF45
RKDSLLCISHLHVNILRQKKNKTKQPTIKNCLKILILSKFTFIKMLNYGTFVIDKGEKNRNFNFGLQTLSILISFAYGMTGLKNRPDHDSFYTITYS